MTAPLRRRFMGIAEQMGRVLQRTSISVNIKERLDFSCALFDPSGALVANAPHLPVHLGAMSAAIQFQVGACLGRLRGPAPADVCHWSPAPGACAALCLQERAAAELGCAPMGCAGAEWGLACRRTSGARRARAPPRACARATCWRPTTRSWRAGRTCQTSP